MRKMIYMGQLIMQILDEMMWWEDHSYDIDLLIYSNPMFFYLIWMSLIKDNMPGCTAVSPASFSFPLFHLLSIFTGEPQDLSISVAHDLSKVKCTPPFSCSGLVQNRHMTYANPIRVTLRISVRNVLEYAFFL